MSRHEVPGPWSRLWTACTRALTRGVRAISVYDPAKRLTGSNEYWEQAIAAQLGWPEQLLPNRHPTPPASMDDLLLQDGPPSRASASGPAEPEFEPVHGWTRRQLRDYLTRNPDYVTTYQAALDQRQPPAASLATESRSSYSPSRGTARPRRSCSESPARTGAGDRANPANV